MDNFKIKVNDEAESKEAQELFEQLGFRACNLSLNVYPKEIGTFNLTSYTDGRSINPELACRELTLPQLRDLVVLHRNDLNDRTHVYTTSTGEDLSAILLGDWWHIFTGGSWQKFTHKDSEKSLLMDRIQPKEEQGLISGADALRALADGKEVEVYMEIPNKLPKTKGWVDASVCSLVAFAFISPSLSFKFRLKPRTITLSLEIPAPFEPKDGDLVWSIQSSGKDGYFSFHHNKDYVYTMGVWRTEEEIKQVVAALRGIKG